MNLTHNKTLFALFIANQISLARNTDQLTFAIQVSIFVSDLNTGLENQLSREPLLQTNRRRRRRRRRRTATSRVTITITITILITIYIPHWIFNFLGYFMHNQAGTFADYLFNISRLTVYDGFMSNAI